MQIKIINFTPISLTSFGGHCCAVYKLPFKKTIAPCFLSHLSTIFAVAQYVLSAAELQLLGVDTLACPWKTSHIIRSHIECSERAWGRNNNIALHQINTLGKRVTSNFPPCCRARETSRRSLSAFIVLCESRCISRSADCEQSAMRESTHEFFSLSLTHLHICVRLSKNGGEGAENCLKRLLAICAHVILIPKRENVITFAIPANKNFLFWCRHTREWKIIQAVPQHGNVAHVA